MRDAEKLSWRKAMGPYETPVLWRSAWQTVNTLVPYATLWYLTYLSLEVSYLLTLALACLTAGFLIRSFIILHDCGHGAFFKSQKANNFLGSIIGVLTFTPYHYWTYEHSVHHATSGDLDRRSVGDIKTWTVDEYLSAPFWKRMRYRFYRNPMVLFGVGPLLLFLIGYRLPLNYAVGRQRRSVIRTNIAILGLATVISSLIGLKAYLMVQLPIIMIGSSAGVWMFYIQHQFEGVYWERHKQWDYLTAALEGSSFYKLPTVLRWLTGNIGYHHIHHLGPRVPNYFLKKCYDENPLFRNIKPITLWTSMRALSLHLWDEKRHELVGWRHLKSLRSAQVP
jgi:omega-6 fatty acid desaturase (delta-12 desaturase)